jgi:hypothetical protein
MFYPSTGDGIVAAQASALIEAEISIATAHEMQGDVRDGSNPRFDCSAANDGNRRTAEVTCAPNVGGSTHQIGHPLGRAGAQIAVCF